MKTFFVIALSKRMEKVLDGYFVHPSAAFSINPIEDAGFVKNEIERQGLTNQDFWLVEGEYLNARD